MQIKHITFQSGHDEQRLFSEYYKEHFTTSGGEEFRAYGLKMLKLIEHLE